MIDAKVPELIYDNDRRWKIVLERAFENLATKTLDVTDQVEASIRSMTLQKREEIVRIVTDELGREYPEVAVKLIGRIRREA